MAEIDDVPLDSVRINGGTQSRAELSQSTIAEYAEAIRLAIELPPVVVFFDGVHRWLADGFHRYHAHREAGAIEIKAEIRTGMQRDAVLYSVGANASHGLRRSNEDKRKAVETLLADPEWATWSNNAIAKACAVSDKTVAAYRAEHLRKSEDGSAVSIKRTVERSGTIYEQDTSKIGKAPAQAAAGASVRRTLVEQVEQQLAPKTEQPGLRAPAAAAAVTPPAIPPTNTSAAGSALATAALASAPARDAESEAEVDPFDQLMQDYSALQGRHADLQAEKSALEQHIVLLTRSDLAAQVDGLVKRADAAELKFDQLAGRNRQLQEKAREAQQTSQYQADLLAKIRVALGVEKNGDILPAITARRAA